MRDILGALFAGFVVTVMGIGFLLLSALPFIIAGLLLAIALRYFRFL